APGCPRAHRLGSLGDKPAQTELDAWPRRVRARVLDHDDCGLPAAAPAQVHDLRIADRARARRGGRIRAARLAGDRAVERFVPDADGAPKAVHARGARADRLLPAAD